MLEQCGKIGEHGSDLSLERWKDSYFFLPFRLNARTSDNQYSGDVGDTVLHKPSVPSGNKVTLFLRFKKTTSYVIR